jgi:hypothetical protein
VTSDPTNLHDEVGHLYDWQVAVWLGEQVSRRWFAAWEYYYRDSLSLLMSFPVTRGLVAESLVATASVSRDVNVGPASRIDRELHFEVDSEADCVGPRYILLPWTLDGKKGLPQLSNITPQGVVGPAGLLTEKNVMLRIEPCAQGRALSVALVGLYDAREGRGAGDAILKQQGALRRADVTYNLEFDGYDPVKLRATELLPA